MTSANVTAAAVIAQPPSARLSAALLVATDIGKSYRSGLWPLRHRKEVLRNASFSLFPGEVVGLVGENGSGKSTLMKILVGAEAADAGTVSRTDNFGYCPQQPLVYPRLTPDEHFELFAHAYRMTDEEARTSRLGIYDSLGFVGYAHTRADQLSGGTLAKLNLGLALLADPDLLILDEPYVGFDWDTYQKFWGLVADRRRAGRCVLIVSHFLADEDRFDRIVDLKDGRAVSR